MEEKNTCKLYWSGIVTGHRRGKHVQHPNRSLVMIDDVASKEEASFYVGKVIVYIYKAKTKKKLLQNDMEMLWELNVKEDGNFEPTRWRVRIGRVTRTHGNRGMVRAKFSKNLSPQTFGKKVHLMLYPSNI